MRGVAAAGARALTGGRSVSNGWGLFSGVGQGFEGHADGVGNSLEGPDLRIHKPLFDAAHGRAREASLEVDPVLAVTLGFSNPGDVFSQGAEKILLFTHGFECFQSGDTGPPFKKVLFKMTSF